MKILVNASIILIFISLTLPCDCAPPPSPEEAYELADAVFSGQVTNIFEDWDNLLKVIYIDVYADWKGSIDNQIIIFTGINDGICGYYFQEGLEYLIYANLSDQNLWTNSCTRTTLLENADEDLEYLNNILYDLGDINSDGQVNIIDIVLLIGFILESDSPTESQFLVSDYNGDGALNVLDVVGIINIILNPQPPNVTITDVDGNIYETIQINEQLWMSENLMVTHYRNGDEIPYSYDDTQYGAYANYNNDDSNVEVYGRLYNWIAVNDERGLCPIDWHVPTDEEFIELEMYLGMSESEAYNEGLRGTDEGGKLKEEGTQYWDNPNTGATNETGFTAIPGGRRRYDTFTNQVIWCCLNRYSFFWSSTEIYTVNAWYRVLSFDYSESNRYHLSKTNAFSVRCIAD